LTRTALFPGFAVFRSRSLPIYLGQKVRASLSALGVFTGTLAMVLMIALVAGARDEIEWQLQSYGTNLLILSSGTRQQGGEQISLEADARLNRSDPEIIRTQIPEVRKTAAAVINPLSVDNHYV
jgi:putative ABC transport system permease protein